MDKVLPFGARVVVTNVDMYGQCGRELHPEETDIGFHGVIVSNFFQSYHAEDGGVGRCAENVPPGTVLRGEDSGWNDDIVYTVVSPDGRRLELMGYEVEALPSLVG